MNTDQQFHQRMKDHRNQAGMTLVDVAFELRTLRHTYASDLIDAGATINEVAGLLGHADISTTQVYLRGVELDRCRAVVESRPYAGDAPSPSVA